MTNFAAHIRSLRRFRTTMKKLVLLALSLFLLSGCSAGMALFSQNAAYGKKVDPRSHDGIKIHFGNPAPVVPKGARIAFPDRRDENNPDNNHAVEFKESWNF